MNKAQVKKVKTLCARFHDALQAEYDTMDEDTYENSEAVQLSVQAQSYAYDVQQCDG